MDTTLSPPIAYRGAGIRTEHPSGERPRWDWRRLLNGKGDGMMDQREVHREWRMALRRSEKALSDRRGRQGTERFARLFPSDSGGPSGHGVADTSNQVQPDGTMKISIDFLAGGLSSMDRITSLLFFEFLPKRS
jgi:hypothetical protein